MATRNSVNLEVTNNADGFAIGGGTTKRTLTLIGADTTITGSGTAEITFPTTTATVATLALTETLTNKTLTSPILTTPALGVATATSIVATGDISADTFRMSDSNDTHYLQLLTNSNLTADRTLTITTGDSNRQITLTGNLTMSGAFNLQFTITGGTNVTLPTTGTLATRAGTETFTNKTLTSPAITTATLSGTQLLSEGASVGFDPVLSADGTYTGLTITGTSGYTQAFGDLVYLDPTDSRWEAVDANAASGADGDGRGVLGMVVVTGTDGNACTILLQGVIRADANFPTFTVNNPIYASETAGDVTQTQPTTTDVVIRIVGAALTTDSMYFNPEYSWTTHT